MQTLVTELPILFYQQYIWCMKKGDGYYLDKFGHTHSEDYLAVTVWYDAQEQLRTLYRIHYNDIDFGNMQ